jgi:cytochrome c2
MALRQDGGKVIAGHQAGGRIAETESGTLLLTIGDFEHDGVNVTDNYPQDRHVDYGKIIEINLASKKATQFSLGHRNPQGLFHDDRGRIWETEHGPQGGDELNLIVRGKDYGWPSVSLGTNYGTHRWPLAEKPGGHKGYEWPNYAWVPSLGISNLIEVRNFSPQWNGDLLVGSLSGQQLRRLRLHGDSVVYDEPIKFNSRLRDIAQLSDGRIVLVSDNRTLVVLEAVDDTKPVLADIRRLLQPCNECHIMSETADTVDAGGRINLWGIYNRPIAGDSTVQYSSGLRSVGGRWDGHKLDRFLKAPVEMVPDTSMLFPGIKDDGQRRKLIDFLKGLN